MEKTTENYLLLKAQGLKRAEIASAFEMTEGQLKKYITKMGWAKKAPVLANESAFSELTEESCYWGGFLAADGNVDAKQRVRIMLNYDDIGHLEKFKDFMQSTHAISSNTNEYYRCSFEFTSAVVCKDLESQFNIVPNKTKILKFPHHLSDANMRHYLRGYFDGDGSVCESFSNKNSTTATLYATFCSGCPEYSEDLFEYLSQHLDLGGNLQYYGTKHQLKYCTNDAKILLSWMYKDSKVHLSRKYVKYLDIVQNNNRNIR